MCEMNSSFFGFRVSFVIGSLSFVIPTADDHLFPLASDMPSLRTSANLWKFRG